MFHRDLKSANLFLNRNGTTKLGDMNVSKVTKNGFLYTQTGTPYYASPEVWKDKPYDSKSDIWSLGCVLYEMTALKPPFRADDMAGLFKKVVKGTFPRIPQHFSQDLENLVKSLLQAAPQLRPSTDQILESPSVVRIGESLFGQDFYEESIEDAPQPEMLATIRVPKNLLYLTDRLPKPKYEKSSQERQIKIKKEKGKKKALPSRKVTPESSLEIEKQGTLLMNQAEHERQLNIDEIADTVK